VPKFQTKYKRKVSGGRRKGPSDHAVPAIRPSADRRLKSVFAKIGVPGKAEFKPDPFQVEAVSAIRHADCLVSAPTGSGKTWIALEAIQEVIKRNGKSWYASPLKALSNSKFIEFGQRFGKENVGILTGDRIENPDAPIIVGTTEILRNQLYDAMHRGEDLAADLVILDEAHFLGDEDRGVVWEEIIIYLPVRIPLLMLSATIGNAHQIAAWLESLREKECVVIEERGRPVPLAHLFFHPTGRLFPLVNRKGLDKKVWGYLNSPKKPVLTTGRKLPPFGEIVTVLRKQSLLPAIFFLKSRADCDNALELCREHLGSDTPHQNRLSNRIEKFVALHPHLARHNQLWHMRRSAVAAHHSGQLPAWKLMVEDLMADGLLDAVFATSTVAAGINVPARSICFFNSDRYNGYKFVPLTATELHQMTGRAGRRGMDNIGFAVLFPGPYMDLPLIAMLIKSPPEDILSQIKIDFSMTLNLLLSHNPEEIRELLLRSFANYLSQKDRDKRFEGRLEKAGKNVMKFLPHALCGSPEAVLRLQRKMSALRREIRQVRENKQGLETLLAKAASLVPGRLFLDNRSRPYCVMKTYTRREKSGVLACRIRFSAKRKKPPKSRFFAPEKVAVILDRVLDAASADDPNLLYRALIKEPMGEMPPPLADLPLGQEEISKLKPLEDRISFLEHERDSLICKGCKHFNLCHGKYNKLFRAAIKGFSYLWDAANAVRENLWAQFMRHLEFLKQEGYVKEDDTLTEDGKWASQLRVDQPLLIAEGLRQGLFPHSDPALLAALIATFVYDREMEIEFDQSRVPKVLIEAYATMKKGLQPLIERKIASGFSVRPSPLWAAATMYAWAKGVDWETVLDIAGMTEGDLAMLASRTADNLRQVTALTEVYPAIAETAADAISLVLREPVVFS
jgi:ATP-dependent RNA helicase HelY